MSILTGMLLIMQKQYWMKYLDRSNAKMKLSGNVHQREAIHILTITFMMSFSYIPKANTSPSMSNIPAYDQAYLDNFYRYQEKDTGRRFTVSDLMAAGTRNGSSGRP